jgi:hypothetical protein
VFLLFYPVISEILGLDTNELMSYHKKWGPSARNCIKLARGIMTATQLENDANIAANKLVSDTSGTISMISDLDATETSHVLFALRPQGQSRDIPAAEIPTPHLRDCLVRAIAKHDAVKQAQFFTQISGHPWFKGSEGHVYEKFVHARLLASPEPLEAIPADSSLPNLCLPIQPKAVPLGGSSLLKSANKHCIPFYWLPVSQSFTSADSIICTNTHVLFIQSTINPYHDAKPEGIMVPLNTLPKRFRDKRIHCLVFVTDSEARAITLRGRHFEGLGDVRIYACVFNIGQSELTQGEKEILEKSTVSKPLYALHFR